MEDQLFSSQKSDLNNDLALCIDSNDNQKSYDSPINIGH